MKRSSLVLAFLIAALVSVPPESANAARNGQGRGQVQSAKRLMRQQQKLALRLERMLAAMNDEQRAQILEHAGALTDSDGDGLPDALESSSGTDLCDDDSDDDGVGDGDEMEDGSDPDDSDSDDDGIEDGEDPDDDEPAEDEPGEEDPVEGEPV